MRKFLAAAAVILGCGSSATGGETGGAANQTAIDDSCAQSCAAQKRCVSTVDETTCINKCKNDAAALANKVRADFVSLINDCVRTASCDKLNDCDDTAKASISPTPTVQTFCDDLMKKYVECKVADTNKSRCLENLKVFADSAIDSARTCLTKACPDFGGCVVSALGGRP